MCSSWFAADSVGGAGRGALLPKTRSGKILRGTIETVTDGEPRTMPAMIDGPAILDQIGSAMKQRRGSKPLECSWLRRPSHGPSSRSCMIVDIQIFMVFKDRNI